MDVTGNGAPRKQRRPERLFWRPVRAVGRLWAIDRSGRWRCEPADQFEQRRFSTGTPQRCEHKCVIVHQVESDTDACWAALLSRGCSPAPLDRDIGGTIAEHAASCIWRRLSRRACPGGTTIERADLAATPGQVHRDA